MSRRLPLAVITARGGSKRIPRKNIKDFCGRPIIAYSIEAALESDLFDHVMVSTDDEEIAAVASSLGAEVPFMRGASASGDFATTCDVLNDVLHAYGARGQSFESLCCIYPTAPFVTAGRLRDAAELFGGGVSCVFAAAEFSFPPQRGRVARDGVSRWLMPEFALSRSQDLEPVYHDAGQFYFCRAAQLATGDLMGDRARMLVLPQTEVQDIDNPTDWVMAEMKYRLMKEKGEGSVETR